jgi:hypothetical protein
MVAAQASSTANHNIRSDWSGGKSVTIEELRSPLNVRIDYIGMKDAYDTDDIWDSRSEVQLVVVVTDGITNTAEDQVFIPIDREGYKMSNFETRQIDRRVFHTSSVGDYLRVSIAAWDIDSKSETLDALSVLEAFGATGAREVRMLYAMLPDEDDRIGDYQQTWYPDENWGIGQHEEICNDNFLLGFSVWSDEEPPLVPQPPLSPDVKIQNVAMPSQVEQSNSGWFYWRYYVNTLTLVNNEPIDIEVDWKASSSVKGEFDQGSTIVPAKGKCDVSRSYFYENDVGPLKLTYTIYYEGRETDSWTGTMNVVPGPYL